MKKACWCVLALVLILSGRAAYAIDTCTIDCWQYEECDGVCEEVGIVPCTEFLYAIIEVCRPYGLAELQQLRSPLVSPAPQVAGNQLDLRIAMRCAGAPAPATAAGTLR